MFDVSEYMLVTRGKSLRWYLGTHVSSSANFGPRRGISVRKCTPFRNRVYVSEWIWQTEPVINIKVKHTRINKVLPFSFLSTEIVLKWKKYHFPGTPLCMQRQPPFPRYIKDIILEKHAYPSHLWVTPPPVRILGDHTQHTCTHIP